MQRILRLALVLSATMLVALACGGNRNAGNVTTTQGNSGSANSNAAASQSSSGSGSAIIEDIHLARDDGSGRVGETVTSFKTTDNPLYCIVQLREPKEGTRVKAEWVLVDAGENTKFTEKEFVTDREMRVVIFASKLPREWPAGDYRVNVFVNDKLEKSLDFQIK